MHQGHQEGQHEEVLWPGLRAAGQHREADQRQRQVAQVQGEPRHDLQEEQSGARHAARRTFGALGEEGGSRVWVSQDQVQVDISHPWQRRGEATRNHRGEGHNRPRVEGGMEAEDEEVPAKIKEILSGSVSWRKNIISRRRKILTEKTFRD